MLVTSPWAAAWMVPVCCWVTGFHRPTVPSSSAVASSAPDGLNAASVRGLLLPGVVMLESACCWVAGFHSRTVPSLLAVASSVPGRLNDTSQTVLFVLVAVMVVPNCCWFFTFHSRTVPSTAACGQQGTVRAEGHTERRGSRCGGVDGRAELLLVLHFPQRTVPSLPAVASSVPEGSNVTPTRPLPAAGMVPTFRSVFGSHSRMVPSPPTVASLAPSGLNATPDAGVPMAAGMGLPTGCWVAVFHRRTRPSLPADASSVPDGLNASPKTRSDCRWRSWCVRSAGVWPRSTAEPRCR